MAGHERKETRGWIPHFFLTDLVHPRVTQMLHLLDVGMGDATTLESISDCVCA